MCISVHQLCYVHADKEPLFQDINLTVNKGQRLALVGNNGTGKSTLLRIIEGSLQPSSGEIICSSRPYYIPQHFGQFDRLTVAEALRVDNRIKALHAILEGDTSVENFISLNDDWNVEEPFGTCLLGFGTSATVPADAFVKWRGKDKGVPFRYSCTCAGNYSDGRADESSGCCQP